MGSEHEQRVARIRIICASERERPVVQVAKTQCGKDLELPPLKGKYHSYPRERQGREATPYPPPLEATPPLARVQDHRVVISR